MKKIKLFLKQLFCNHKYEYKEDTEFYDPVYESYYSIHIYICNKCGKEDHRIEI